MDHRRIDDQNIAELYVTGRLSPEDEETFESHLLECSECRERVSWADDLRSSIRAVAAEEVGRASAQLGFLAWLSRRTRSARAGLLMAALLAVAALPAWLQADRARMARELEQARSEERTAAERPSAPVPAPAAPTADPRLESLAQENSRLEQELSASRQQVAQLSEPQVNARVVSLGVVRGESEPLKIEIGPSPEPILVSLELDAVEHDTYRVTLLEGRTTVWRKDGFQPTSIETLNVLLNSGSLKPGASYRFVLEGIEPGGRAVPAGEISFRAVNG